MSKDRRLGRGLAALLGSAVDDEPAVNGIDLASLPATAPPAATPRPTGDLLRLNVYEIDDNPFQPRREFNEPEIASLAESLKEHDMLQPILVRRVGDRYQLISGERRLRAAIQAGWSHVPARIREADDRLVAELAIVENLQRKDLNPVEKAMSFKRYLDQHGCTQEDLARRLKIDRSTIANLMRLLELPAVLLDAIRSGELSAGHARALLPLGDEAEQLRFGERIQAEGWSVRDVEREVQAWLEQAEPDILAFAAPASAERPRTAKNEQVAALEHELKMALGAKVEIRSSSRGRGRIIVHFANSQEFDRLRSLLQSPPAANAPGTSRPAASLPATG